MAGCIVPRLYDRLAAYEDTGLEPEDITKPAVGCVFYCNRQCNLNGDWCSEGPGCPYEMDKESARKILVRPDNTPLTLEELREMDGKPVWAECLQSPDLSCWGYHDTDEFIGYHANFADGNYGKVWFAYRRKPEGMQ